MKAIRSLIERASRNTSFKRRIRVNGRLAPIFVSPDAQLKYFKPGLRAFDEDLIRVAEKLLDEDSVVWDIGVNVGVFTFAAASAASKGTILAVEPDLWLAQLIQKTARLKHYQGIDIRVLAAGVSSSDGVSRFLVANRGRASNSLASTSAGRTQSRGTRQTQYIPTLTLDTIAEKMPKPDFVEVDVEGAELLLLQGASRLLREDRPTFYMEIGKIVQSDIFELFSQNDYSAFSTSGSELPAQCDYHSLFLPNEKLGSTERLSPASLDLFD